MKMKSIFFIILSCFQLVENANNRSSNKGATTLIIMGANGDLAKRKIWPSVQELIFRNLVDTSLLHIYAASRQPTQTTIDNLNHYFKHLSCATLKDFNENCTEFNHKIASIVTPCSLKIEQDYEKLHHFINSRLTKENLYEAARIFYLSVPPFAYTGIAQNIDRYARPSSDDTILRVAVEKPFGKDLQSAQTLADHLQKYLNSNEVLIVDHYLHKPGVSQILDFRLSNLDKLNPIWNAKYISHVEVVAREMLSVEGRTYYDQYGVVRDMLQNHLTEIVALLIADLTNFTSVKSGTNFDLNKAKLEALKTIYPPFVNNVVLGQYSDYQTHLFHDLDKTKIGSRTPTFAVVLMNVRSPQWFGIPIFLISGKLLGKKETYARIVFKQSLLSWFPYETRQCTDTIVFNIETDNYRNYSIEVPFGKGYNMYHFLSHQVDGTCKMTVFIPDNQQPLQAYASIIKNLIEGKDSYFIPLKNALQSWHVWSPLLHELDRGQSNLLIYSSNLWNNMKLSVNDSDLILSFKHNDIQYAQRRNQEEIVFDNDNNFVHYISTNDVTSFTNEDLFGHQVYTLSRSELAQNMSHDIYHAALKSIQERGVYHVVFPGGMSPLTIYQALVLSYKDSFPWTKTHVWQTDERCVTPTSVESNFNQLMNHLLDLVPIPYTNIHPLYKNCMTERTQDNISQVMDGLFDYVLLGVGGDGHIASIFTSDVIEQEIAISDSIHLINLLSTSPISIKKRVSLTIKQLIKAKIISVMITGDGKCDLLKKIKRQCLDTSNITLPIAQLLHMALPGTVKVWIDRDLCN